MLAAAATAVAALLVPDRDVLQLVGDRAVRRRCSDNSFSVEILTGGRLAEEKMGESEAVWVRDWGMAGTDADHADRNKMTDRGIWPPGAHRQLPAKNYMHIVHQSPIFL